MRRQYQASHRARAGTYRSPLLGSCPLGNHVREYHLDPNASKSRRVKTTRSHPPSSIIEREHQTPHRFSILSLVACLSWVHPGQSQVNSRDNYCGKSPITEWHSMQTLVLESGLGFESSDRNSWLLVLFDKLLNRQPLSAIDALCRQPRRVLPEGRCIVGEEEREREMRRGRRGGKEGGEEGRERREEEQE